MGGEGGVERVLGAEVGLVGGRRLASTLLSVCFVASISAAAEEIIDSGALIPQHSTAGPDPRGRGRKSEGAWWVRGGVSVDEHPSDPPNFFKAG